MYNINEGNSFHFHNHFIISLDQETEYAYNVKIQSTQVEIQRLNL